MIRSTRLFLSCVVIAAAALPAQVSPEIAKLIKQEGLKNSKVMQHLDYLTNQIGHRLTGSDNFTRACNWARQEFEKMGLDAHLEKWGEWKVVWNRGQWHGRITEPIEMDLQIATSAWTPGTKGRIKAQVVRAPRGDDIDESLRGKWVIDRRLPRQGDRRRLAEVGVAGIIYSLRGDAKFPNRMRVFGSYRRPERKLVQIGVRRDQFKKFWRLARESEKADPPVKIVAEFDIRNRYRDEKIALHNVVAEIKGSQFPDEVVIVCGHLDSWHQATGTTDNGTGTTSTMEAARILAAVGCKPRRTIRFILWGGEEQGLLGSVGYVRRHRQEMDKVSAVFNHDTGTNWARSLTVSNAMYSDMQKVIEPILSMKAPDEGYSGATFKLGRKARLGRGGGGSDHASFLAVGVPAFPWGLTGRANYFSYTWHSQWDTYDSAIPEYQRHTSTVIALTALGVANLDHMLARGDVARSQPKPDAAKFAEARLGVELDEALIKSVSAGSIAKAAGLQAGDVVVSINKEAVKKAVDIVSIMRDSKSPWVFVVRRGEKRIGVVVEPKAAKAKTTRAIR